MAGDDSAWWRAAIDAAPAAMLVVGGDERILLANAHTERTFGRPRAELEGSRLEALLVPESRRLVRDDLTGRLAASAAAREPAVHRDLYGVNGAGERFPIELSLGSVVGAGAARAVVVIRDVTEQRRSEEVQAAATVEARAERERLEALLEFAPAFIIGVNSQGAIDFINRTLPQHPKKDVIGASWLQYFPPERQAVMSEALRTLYETGAVQTFETNTPGPDGQTLWFDSQIAPIRVAGQIVGAVLVSQEATDRKRAQAELLAGRHMALLGTLAAGVAHEINTPIQFVGDSIQFLRDAARDLLTLLEKLQELRHIAVAGRPLDLVMKGIADAEAEADLPYIRQNMPVAFDRCIDGLSRVTTIVRSLKDFAHPATKDMVAADLNRAVQSTLIVATSEYKYVAELQTKLGDLPPVTCHVSEISQAILNIVVNAAHAIGDVVKGTDRKGSLTVKTWRDGDDALISISDTGGGIPDTIRARVFDPFFTTKEVGKGTGQGLAIALTSVKDRHGGDLTFETKAGEGTTFLIRLPIAGAPPAP